VKSRGFKGNEGTPKDPGNRFVRGIRLDAVGLLVFVPGAGRQKPGFVGSHERPAAQQPPAGHFVSESEQAAEHPGTPLASTTH
jgi:hypothetical protein